MLPRTLLYCTENVAGIHAYELSIQCWAIIGFAPNSVPYQKSKSWTPLPKHHASPCADPGIFVKGGGGGPGHLTKKALTTFFFFFFFFCPQQILQTTNGQFQRNLSFYKVPEGVQHFPGGGGGGGGGVQLFPGGVQLLIPYRNPYNL